MKKHMIAFMLCLAMVVASIGGSSVLAAEMTDETGITEGSVAETADDDEATAVEPADDDDEATDDETAVVETPDDAADDENVVQAIWTRGNSTITFTMVRQLKKVTILAKKQSQTYGSAMKS